MTLPRVMATVALLGAAAHLLAQQPQRPVFRSDVNLVTVDAYPLKDGRVVTGLTKEDFQVLEDGRPQTIESFEFVEVGERLADSARRDPASQSDMLEQLADPRARAFVAYLDVHHIGIPGAYFSRQPLVELFQRILGPRDLIALTTSRQPAREISFGRRSDIVEQQLRDYWTFREPDVTMNDAEESAILACYPAAADVTAEMIRRRRQDQLLTSLEELVDYLGFVREGRKTVFLFSKGWRGWYAPDRTLLAPLERPGYVAPKGPGLIREPGRSPTFNDELWRGGRAACEQELFRLANLDSAPRFRALLRNAAAANVAFYPVDPSGVGGEFVSRTEGYTYDRLLEMARNTGGTAVYNRNDLVQGVIDVSREFDAYYLLSYASDNPKTDGTVRRLEVKVRRDGLTVKARQSYRALSAAEAARPEPTAPTTVSPEREAVTRALDALGAVRTGDGEETRFDLHRYLPTDAPPLLGRVSLFRATPSSRSPLVPISAPLMRRTERLHLEWDVLADLHTRSARVLGKDGQPRAVQVTVSERPVEATTSGAAMRPRVMADVVLAPLAPGDYVVELVVAGPAGERTVHIPFRVAL